MEYVATFFSHFGAMQFAKKLKRMEIPHRMMPVPRQLSSLMRQLCAVYGCMRRT